MKPIVMITSFPPRLCGIGTFAEEAIEFIQKNDPHKRDVHIISHTDGLGDNVIPLIDLSRPDWWKDVAEKVHKIDPSIVHVEHEYGLYNYIDEKGQSDLNAGFLHMLEALTDVPTIIEPHTVHGRLRPIEEEFILRVTQLASVVIFKCAYQKWRLEWMLWDKGIHPPKNIVIIPHGARPDRRYRPEDTDAIKEELGQADLCGKRLAGLVGWIQRNKRWDIAADIWADVGPEICEQTGQEWILFAAGDMRDPNHRPDYEKYLGKLRDLEARGLARFFRFIPRGEIYYKVMNICDFVILPTLDETQSGTLARIIALNKPYVTTAPLEGLTAQTVESDGGFLFTDRDSLKRALFRLAEKEDLRWRMGNRLRKYLETTVSWDIVARQYLHAYEEAADALTHGAKPEFPSDFGV